jgi:nitrate reductase gamma subunit
MNNSREVWFARRRWLVLVNYPVHWKGWLMTGLFIAAIIAILSVVQFADVNFAPEPKRLVQAIGGIAGVAAAIAFFVTIIRHAGD